MTPITRFRLELHLARLADDLEVMWHNWLGWAVVVGIAVGTAAAVAVVCWKYGL